MADLEKLESVKILCNLDLDAEIRADIIKNLLETFLSDQGK
jgi:hypothetical protein